MFKLKKKNLFDNIILLLLFSQLLILGYFGKIELLNKIISILIIIKIIPKSNIQKQNKYFLLLIMIIMFFLFESYAFGFNLNIAKSNFLILLYPLFYTYYLYDLNCRKPYYLKNIIERNRKTFNIILLINVLFVFFQSTKHILLPTMEYVAIDFDKDVASGLFYYGGTHCLCMFNIFIILLNMSYIKKENRFQKKILCIIVTILMIALSIWMSSLNDNKVFLIFLPLFIFARMLFKLSEKRRNRIILFFRKHLIMIVSIIVIVIIVYYNISSFKIILDEYLFKTIDVIMNTTNNSIAVNGSNERIGMITYSLTHPETWFLGIGIGKINFYTRGLLGFNHFGISSLGALLILGGLLFTALIYYFYIKVIYNSLLAKTSFKKYLVVLLILFISMYNQCLFIPTLMFISILDILVLEY